MTQIAQKDVPEEAHKAMNKAKVQMMLCPDTTFFTTVLFSLQHMWDYSVQTACTNGKWIRYNPDFFMKFTPKQQLGLMLHETYHVIWMHMARLNDRDITKWNVATDYAINIALVDGGWELPPGGLIDEKYRGMSADEIYALLPDPDPDKVDIHFTEGDEEGSTPLETEAHIQDVLIRAQMQSKMAGDAPGSIPGEIELYINRLLKPKLPTATLLRKFFYDMGKDDYSWRKPNRRFFPKHHLPSLYSEVLGHVAFFADLSASVTDAQVLRYISEVGGVMKQLRPKRLTLGSFDTDVRGVEDITNIGQLAQTTFTGRGGTDIGPVLAWAKQHKPKALIIFTDGYFSFSPDFAVPECPVMWLINDNTNFKPPYGKVIEYESDR
jgi:predicted metal-dependent peptidase